MSALTGFRVVEVAERLTYPVIRDRRVAVNQILVRTAEQTW